MIKNTPKTWFAVSNAIAYSGVLSIALLTSVSPAQAQIVPDKTLPVNSQVSPGTCATCTVINGGTVRGANLFHSFREFSIPTGGEAYFNNAAQIQNILTRVTGSSISNIDGLIRANGIANLYLLNPNGIVFGPNASLNIGGSFVGTTAGSLKLPDGSEYSATNPQAPSLLAVNLVPGVQFGAGPSGSTITNAGNLAVTGGQNLTLLGGTTTSTGTLTAPEGTVQVLGDRVALLENARVDVSSPTGGGTVLVGGDYQGKGSVPNATRTYLGPNATINADATINGNGGKVIVWADEITGFYGKISAQGGGNTGDGGFVEVSGKQNLAFRGNVDVSSSQGNAGKVLLDPENIIIVANGGANDAELTDSQILFGDSPGATFTVDKTALEAITGNITLEATNNITISQGVSLNFADPIPSCTISCPSNPSAPVKIVFKADADKNSAGDFHIDPTQNIQALGRSVEISGANVIVGDIKTNLFSNGSPTNFAGSKAGDVTLTATKGNLFVGNITAKAFSDNPTENEFNVRGSGNVTLQASNGTITSGNIDTQAFIKDFVSGNGGKLTITAKGNIQTGSLISRSDAGIGGDVANKVPYKSQVS